MNDMANRIAALIGKYLKQELSHEDRRELNTWIEDSTDNREIFEHLTNTEYLEQTIQEKYSTNPVESTRKKLNRLIEAEEEPVRNNRNVPAIWPRFAVAAAILILLAGTAVYIFKINKQRRNGVTLRESQNPVILPGTTKATLKLSNGQLIVLDSSATGKLAQQGSTQVMNKNGRLVYTSPADGRQEVLWNTLSTARGQTYPLLLSDGSRITLNAESSIRFPVVFTGDIREVQVTGEVFFEVAHDATRPFIVTAGDMNLQVLGTTFNINAYTDEEAIKATLVEGAIQVKKGNQKKNIRPGQQAQVLPNEIKVTEIDVDKITAWKQGLFRFKEDKLSEAMKNVARWYNVDVVFEGNSANVGLSGTIPRIANLSEVVKALSLLDVEARIEGRKMILKAQ